MTLTCTNKSLDIQIYDSKTKSRWILPDDQHEVSIYCCGPTVYDICHLGHAKTYLNMDMVVRFLKYRGKKVTYIRNITDLDDKIIQAANKYSTDYKTFIDSVIERTNKEFSALNLLEPDVEPRATDYVSKMEDFIITLINKGMTFKKFDGIYFDVSKLDSYGELSNQVDKLKKQKSSRMTLSAGDPSFVLWKFAKKNEPFFNSTLGKGRPGWHIECSAMILHTIGKQVDIHAGGCDLIFPHHENELAQSLTHNDCTLAKCWMHFGLVRDSNKVKMSKSLGNMSYVKDILNIYDSNHLRLMTLMSHYRSHITFDWKKMDTCVKVWNKIKKWIELESYYEDQETCNQDILYEFEELMADNFNFAKVYSWINSLIKKHPNNQRNKNTLKHILNILGFIL